MISQETDIKYLSVDTLINILSNLPKYNLVSANAVGNLLIMSPDTLISRGYIDFINEGEYIEL